MNNMTPIVLEGEQVISLKTVVRAKDQLTVVYDGINGADSITVPATMPDAAIRSTIRHREWMKKYPPEA